jgi:hypothetical protein
MERQGNNYGKRQMELGKLENQRRRSFLKGKNLSMIALTI